MHKNVLGVVMIFVVIGMLSYGCKEPEPSEPGGGTTGPTVARVSGRVLEGGTSIPLVAARVTLVLPNKPITVTPVTTDSSGTYAFNVDLGDTNPTPGILSVTKSGFRQSDSAITLSPRQPLVKDISLTRDTVIIIGTGSTYPNSIALISTSVTQMAVKGVGGIESGVVIYEVRDSLGFPIDINHQDTVIFSVNPPFLGRVLPIGVITNAAGRAATTINSDTISGSIQIVAQLRRDTDGLTIRSEPVRIVIHGGLPDQAHFTIGAARRNFDAYDWLGRSNSVSVLVGDKYSNPVQPGTAVYFSTTGGVIQAQGYTGSTGQTQVLLFSGNPLPRAVLDPVLYPPSLFGDGTGYAWIRATTVGERGVIVKDSLLMLFSGTTTIGYTVQGTSDPTQICFTSGGSQNVQLRVADRFGNPLTSGTSISYNLEVTADSTVVVNVRGLPTRPLDDYLTRGLGRTDFNVTVYDATPGGATSSALFTLKLNVTGLNGSAFVDIPGRIRLPSDPPCP